MAFEKVWILAERNGGVIMKKVICYVIIAMLLYEPLTVSTADISPQVVNDTPVIEKAVITPIEEPVSIGECKLTAYCKENYPHICNNGDSSKTATGTTPTANRTVAVDPSVIPYGSEVIINGHTYIAEDCGSAIKGNRVDILFDTHREALEFGVQYAEVSYISKEVC